MLDQANGAHPGVWWWVKADGCDLTSGSGESMRHTWTGDVDVHVYDGKLEALFDEYMGWREFVEGLGMRARGGDGISARIARRLKRS